MIRITTWIVSCAFLLVTAGCESAPDAPTDLPTGNGNGPDRLFMYARYAPEKIYVLPLTEFVPAARDPEPSRIKIYVSVLDAFDCQIKTPGRFRFELYEQVPRSAEPKGKRITIWPDIDLNEPLDNNKYWQDHFRAYEFTLDFTPERGRGYILKATCLCPNGRRLSATFVLKYAK
ncbi:MAG: hypothetical protein ACYSTF_09425 [Planctomycetota bacterium]